mmetsp:Transcript_15424/g.22540  ORF Transcript_15424/g.22540 Transcript_15424/m.22540 type:complete len:318 (+) Transcript_15424:321-1274(+)
MLLGRDASGVGIDEDLEGSSAGTVGTGVMNGQISGLIGKCCCAGIGEEAHNIVAVVWVWMCVVVVGVCIGGDLGVRHAKGEVQRRPLPLVLRNLGVRVGVDKEAEHAERCAKVAGVVQGKAVVGVGPGRGVGRALDEVLHDVAGGALKLADQVKRRGVELALVGRSHRSIPGHRVCRQPFPHGVPRVRASHGRSEGRSLRPVGPLLLQYPVADRVQSRCVLPCLVRANRRRAPRQAVGYDAVSAVTVPILACWGQFDRSPFHATSHVWIIVQPVRGLVNKCAFPVSLHCELLLNKLMLLLLCLCFDLIMLLFFPNTK